MKAFHCDAASKVQGRNLRQVAHAGDIIQELKRFKSEELGCKVIDRGGGEIGRVIGNGFYNLHKGIERW